jgi:hypothetical protein
MLDGGQFCVLDSVGTVQPGRFCYLMDSFDFKCNLRTNVCVP